MGGDGRGDMADDAGDGHAREPIEPWTMADTAIANSLRPRLAWASNGFAANASVRMQALEKRPDGVWYRDGDWCRLEQLTRKPFQQIKGDATRAPHAGSPVSSRFMVAWKDNQLRAKPFGSEATCLTTTTTSGG